MLYWVTAHWEWHIRQHVRTSEEATGRMFDLAIFWIVSLAAIYLKFSDVMPKLLHMLLTNPTNMCAYSSDSFRRTLVL